MKVKITCTKEEKEATKLRLIACDRCVFSWGCPNGGDCEKCIEEHIEWEVTDSGQ